MDEGAKRMEEGLNSALDEDGNKDDLKKQVTVKSSKGSSTVEHEKDTMAKPVTVDEPSEQPVVKKKTKRVATLDAFRGLTIVVSALQNPFLCQTLCMAKLLLHAFILNLLLIQHLINRIFNINL